MLPAAAFVHIMVLSDRVSCYRGGSLYVTYSLSFERTQVWQLINYKLVTIPISSSLFPTS